MFPKAQLWQDPVPDVNHELIDAKDVAALKGRILERASPFQQLVSTAWASASTFRGSDKRGGANGARIRLAPQKDWEVNQPAELAKVLKVLEAIQKDFNKAPVGRQAGLARRSDRAGRMRASRASSAEAGHDVRCRSCPGAPMRRRSMTDVESFAVLEPTADGFRNYLGEPLHATRGRKKCWWIGLSC
jgi:catalase-peroxidase